MKKIALSMMALVAGISAVIAQSGYNLVGTSWKLESYGEISQPVAVIADTEVTLEFGADNQAYGNGGCNGFSGTYEATDTTLSFANLVSTLMGCLAEGIAEQEQAYFDALQAATHYQVIGGKLMIDYGDGLRLTFAPLPFLSNTQWQLVEYGDPNALTSVIPNSVLSLMFIADNGIAGEGGCNSFAGSWQNNADGTLTFGQVVSTRKACLDADLTAQEQAYFDGLGAVITANTDGDTLTLTGSDGQVWVFARQLSLVDATWQLEVFLAGDAIMQPLPESPITLEFSSNGFAGGKACNNYSTTYTLDNQTLTFGQIISTMMACEEIVMSHESVYLGAFNLPFTYTIVDDYLTLQGTNEVTLTFVAVR